MNALDVDTRRRFPPLFFSLHWSGLLLLLALNATIDAIVLGYLLADGQTPAPGLLHGLAFVPVCLLLALAFSARLHARRALQGLAARVCPQAPIEAAHRDLQRSMALIASLSALPLLLMAACLPADHWAQIGLVIALFTGALLLGQLGAACWADTLSGRWRRWHQLLDQRFQGITCASLGQALTLVYLIGISFNGFGDLLGVPRLPSWGTEQDWRWSLRMLMLTMMAFALLRGPALHWRRMLAPGGTQRGALGLRLLAYSLRGILLPLLAAVLLVTFARAGWSPESAWPMLAALPGLWLPLAAELTLATAVAALAAGNRWVRPSVLALLGACLVALLGLAAHFAPGALAALHWRRDGGHLAACVLLTLVSMPAVSRVWEQADLARIARRLRVRPRQIGDD